MENIKLSQKSNDQINNLIKEKDKTLKELSERYEKSYSTDRDKVNVAFKDKLETFMLAIISQVGDESAEYELASENGEFELKLKVKEDAPILNDDK